ncbi:MAG: alanine dehydrogenase [Cyclobacteriaceae bacterium]
MSKIRLGILIEGKIPVDQRVPIVPYQAQQIKDQFPDVEVVCEKSEIRCFNDDNYISASVEMVDDVSSCDILFGVKEVPIPNLLPEKTYFFFSHTIKKQDYNRELLREVLRKKITLIDYECLTDANGQRVIAFGRYAGVVGAYNAIWTFGKRYNLFHLRRAHECFDLEDLKSEYDKVQLPKIKIALTGGGRVSKGAMEVLFGLGIRQISPMEFIEKSFDEPVFTQLNNRDYNKHKDDLPFNRAEFFNHPENFLSDFQPVYQNADILIGGAYWHPQAPVLFSREDMLRRDFKIKVIADITCDIEGSIPSTKRPCTLADPIYDYDPTQDKVAPSLSDEGNVTVMAVDNLPSELPRNASEDFGKQLISNVIPHLLGEDKDGIIERATIAKDGKLTSYFSYLQGYVDGKE